MKKKTIFTFLQSLEYILFPQNSLLFALKLERYKGLTLARNGIKEDLTHPQDTIAAFFQWTRAKIWTDCSLTPLFFKRKFKKIFHTLTRPSLPLPTCELPFCTSWTFQSSADTPLKNKLSCLMALNLFLQTNPCWWS